MCCVNIICRKIEKRNFCKIIFLFIYRNENFPPAGQYSINFYLFSSVQFLFRVLELIFGGGGFQEMKILVYLQNGVLQEFLCSIFLRTMFSQYIKLSTILTSRGICLQFFLKVKF